MRNITGTLIVLLVLLSSSMAFGGDLKFDGNELLSDCNAVIQSVDKTSRNYSGGYRCMGQILGIVDLNAKYFLIIGNRAFFCLPPNVTIGQLTRVVAKSLNEHPERLHERGTELIIKAFMDAYPCK